MVVVRQGAGTTLLKHLSVPSDVGPLLLQELGQARGAVRTLPPDKAQPVLRLSGHGAALRRGEKEVRNLRNRRGLRRVELPEVPREDDVEPCERSAASVRAPPPGFQSADQLPEPPIGLRPATGH